MSKAESRSLSFYLLMGLLFFQGISGLYGGGALVLDPSGGILQMPLNLLEGSPFTSYLIPGVILFVVLGIGPMMVLYGLYQQKGWGWPGSVLISIALIVWIGVEVLMVGYHADPPLQLVYGLLGILLLGLTLYVFYKKGRGDRIDSF